MISLKLPFPPSVNHYYRRVGPRTLISREGRRFRERVCSLLAATRVKPMDGRLDVYIDVCPPDRRRRDLDNVLKALLDALEHGGAYRDDSQIDRLRIERHQRVADGYVRVTVCQM